ncbi:MAG: hypothetical protein EP319_15655 [Deltaproteobacteria bacterium]|nr:MAG: hypothetical protein EP319_15655 [Deltaproteobacteria bacterium]
MLGRDFYISQNLRGDGKTYIAPTSQNVSNAWLIEVENMWKGEQILKKMIAKTLLPPDKKPEHYEQIRIDQTDLGNVTIFKVKII